MAVPKKRTGHSAQGKRRANWKATKPALSKCSNCGATVLAHTVCPECGYYKGKPVSIKAAEEKKVAKATKAAEEKQEKTTVVEEKPAKKTTAKKSETTEKKPAAKKPAAKKTTKKSS